MTDQYRFFEYQNYTLSGKKASQEELDSIGERFKFIDWITDYQDLLKTVNIIGASFELSEISDQSGMGVDMEWMAPADQIDEAFNFYPGLLVVEKGFIPVGSCLKGSGDPYFLRVEDKQWMIYRVLHDFDSFSQKMVEFVSTLDVLLEIGTQYP